VNCRNQFDVVERLLEYRVRHDYAPFRRSGDDDPGDRSQCRVSVDVVQHVEPADARQQQVDQNQMRTQAMFEQVQGLLPSLAATIESRSSTKTENRNATRSASSSMTRMHG